MTALSGSEALQSRPLRKPASAQPGARVLGGAAARELAGPASSELARRAARDALGRSPDDGYLSISDRADFAGLAVRVGRWALAGVPHLDAPFASNAG
jgi:hypothetical protein